MEKWQLAQGEKRLRDEARKARRAEARKKKKSAGESPAAPAPAPAVHPPERICSLQAGSPA